MGNGRCGVMLCGRRDARCRKMGVTIFRSKLNVVIQKCDPDSNSGHTMLRARAGRLRLAQRVWQARSSTFLRRVHSDASKVKIVSGAGSTGKTTHGVQTVVDFLTETTLPTRKAPTNSFAGTDVLILSATESLSYDTSHKVLEHISLTDAARCEFATPSSFTDQVIQLASAASGVTSLRAVDAAQSLVNVKTHLSSLPLSAESSTEVSYQPRPNHEDSFVTAFLKYYQELHSWGVRQSGHAQSDEVPEHQTLSCVAASALLSNDAFCQTEHAGLHLPLLRSAKVSSPTLCVFVRCQLERATLNFCCVIGT